jgi:hypothetical protein
LFRI